MKKIILKGILPLLLVILLLFVTACGEPVGDIDYIDIEQFYESPAYGKFKIDNILPSAYTSARETEPYLLLECTLVYDVAEKEAKELKLNIAIPLGFNGSPLFDLESTKLWLSEYEYIYCPYCTPLYSTSLNLSDTQNNESIITAAFTADIPTYNLLPIKEGILDTDGLDAFIASQGGKKEASKYGKDGSRVFPHGMTEEELIDKCNYLINRFNERLRPSEIET